MYIYIYICICICICVCVCKCIPLCLSFVGTLGQKVPWDISNTDTYQYPLSPKDVLFDPFIPTLSQMEDDKYDELGGGEAGKKTVISDLESDSAEEEDKVINFNDSSDCTSICLCRKYLPDMD